MNEKIDSKNFKFENLKKLLVEISNKSIDLEEYSKIFIDIIESINENNLQLTDAMIDFIIDNNIF